MTKREPVTILMMEQAIEVGRLFKQYRRIRYAVIYNNKRKGHRTIKFDRYDAGLVRRIMAYVLVEDFVVRREGDAGQTPMIMVRVPLEFNMSLVR